MDPLSITVSVLTLLQLTEKIVSYIEQTKDASKEQARVLGEAFSLVWLLRRLKECIDEHSSQDPWLQATSALVTLGGPLDQYKHTLELLVRKIIPSHGLRKVGQVLAWKFSREEVIGLLSQIERVKSLVLIALEMDHSTLSNAIKEDLQSVQIGIADLKVDTSTIVDATSEIKSDTTALCDDNAVRHKHDLMRWICLVDYHVQQQDFIDRHQAGTGQWFLQDTKFQAWDRSKDETLFCPGVPGAGKTIMAALVVNYLLRSQHVANEPVTFIYCSYKRQSEQSAKHMLSSILRQIVDIQPGIPKLVQDLYASHTTKRTIPSSDEIRQILEAISRDLHGLTIVVDALDECEARARQEFLSAVETLRGRCEVRLLATSKFLPAIGSHSAFLGKPKLEVRASDEDLERYIRSRAGELHGRVVAKPDLFEDLVFGTVGAVGGMFLLAQLLMDSFRDKMTVSDVKSAIRNLPQGSSAYDKAYHDAMERIFAQGKGSSEMAKRTLAWILCARRPLNTLELLHALAVEPGDTELDEDNILETEQLLTICAGLVTIDEQSDNVRFIHYTTQEYLQRNQQTWLPHAKIEIARTCTAYLSMDNFAVSPCSSQSDHQRRLKAFVLLEYAAVHWGSHTNLLTGTGGMTATNGTMSEALALLKNAKCLRSMSQVLFMSKRLYISNVTVEEEGGGFSGIHWMGMFGLVPLAEMWLQEGYEVDECDLRGRTPLSWAAGSGEIPIAELLLKTGKVNVNSKDNDGRTALSWAAENGHNVMAKLLLDTGKVNVDSKDRYGRTPLSLAARSGGEAVVELLLDTGKVEVDSKDNVSRTALSLAAWQGREAIVKLLLYTGKVEVDSRDNDDRTPLSWATRSGREAIVKLLLDTGKVDVDSKDKNGRTALSWAAWIRTESINEVRRDTIKADSDSEDSDDCEVLSWAPESGDGAIIKLLLNTGKVEIDSKDNDGRTALSWAVRGGQEAIVKLLLDTGKVDVDSKDNDGWTALSWAASKKHKKHQAIVKLLRDTGNFDADSKHNDALGTNATNDFSVII